MFPSLFLIHPLFTLNFSKEAEKYVVNQIHEYIAFLEEQCGKKMDMDRMEEVGRLSVKAQNLWSEVLNSTAHKPAPMTAFDAFFHLALIVTLRGKEVCVDYYRELPR